MSVYLCLGIWSVSKGLERTRCSPDGKKREIFEILKANWEEEESQLIKNLSEGNQVLLGILYMAFPHCCEKGGCEINSKRNELH